MIIAFINKGLETPAVAVWFDSEDGVTFYDKKIKKEALEELGFPETELDNEIGRPHFREIFENTYFPNHAEDHQLIKTLVVNEYLPDHESLIIDTNAKVPRVIVWFKKDNSCTFFDQRLKSEIITFGIKIPPFLQSQYGGKIITLASPEYETPEHLEKFRRAFQEIYFPNCLERHSFFLANT